MLATTDVYSIANAFRDGGCRCWCYISADTSTSASRVDAPKPWPNANERLIYGSGAWIDPLKRLSTFEDKEFEIFVLQWVDGYLGQKYDEVQQRGSSGDKGRDIVAWIDPPKTPKRRWDLYQCKHYKSALSPSQFHEELGKLCVYIDREHYTVPQNYFIVTHKGVGSSLQDLIDEPEKLRASLKQNWVKQCSKNIISGEDIALTGTLLDVVNTIDFSVIHTVSPTRLIEEHSHTKYHSYVFGVKLKPRPPVPKPPQTPTAKETEYVSAIFGAFTEHVGTAILSIEGFSSISYLQHSFNHARVCFYSAESLKEFSRETWPDDSCFNAIEEMVHQGVQFAMTAPHKDGFERMQKVCEVAVSVQVDPNNPLGMPSPNDRVGICHQLANNGTIKWVVKT